MAAGATGGAAAVVAAAGSPPPPGMTATGPCAEATAAAGCSTTRSKMAAGCDAPTACEGADCPNLLSGPAAEASSSAAAAAQQLRSTLKDWALFLNRLGCTTRHCWSKHHAEAKSCGASDLLGTLPMARLHRGTAKTIYAQPLCTPARAR